MGKNDFNGELLIHKIKGISGTREKMEALNDAIRQADNAGEDRYRLIFRYDYCCEATFRDDPTKAIPVAAEFVSIYEENPDALPGEAGVEAYLMIMQMGIDPIVRLPQIPMEQWESMMEKFYASVKKYNIGLKIYWKQMALFWRYVDREKTFEYFQKFWKIGRDGLSDCRACDRSFAVEISLLMGDREAADEYAKPLKAGRFQFCSDTPQLYLHAYLENALDRGNLEEAVYFANRLHWKSNRDKSDLSYIGAIIRCWAYSDLDKAVERFASRLEWTIGMWDKKKIYDFYKGAWVCFKELSKRQETIGLDLPQDFAAYKEDGVYNCTSLAEWFHDEAEKIGKQFDRRNGSDYFERNLSAACACEKR